MFANKQKVKSFVEIIDPVFPKSMNRKSDVWRNSKKLFEVKNYPKCIYCSSDVYKGGELNRYICRNCNRSFKSVYLRQPISKSIKDRIINLWNSNTLKKIDIAKKLNIKPTIVYNVLRKM